MPGLWDHTFVLLRFFAKQIKFEAIQQPPTCFQLLFSAILPTGRRSICDIQKLEPCLWTGRSFVVAVLVSFHFAWRRPTEKLDRAGEISCQQWGPAGDKAIRHSKPLQRPLAEWLRFCLRNASGHLPQAKPSHSEPCPRTGSNSQFVTPAAGEPPAVESYC